MHDLSQIYIFLLQSQRVERNFFQSFIYNSLVYPPFFAILLIALVYINIYKQKTSRTK